jgi:molecular chaperone GrpE
VPDPATADLDDEARVREGSPAEAGGPTGTAPVDAAPAADQSGPTAQSDQAAQSDQTDRVAELVADLQRLQAEYVNYKRRVDRDRDLVLQNAKFSVLSALLPVLDDVDRAREHGELVGGFRAVAESLERVVAGEGLVRFGEPGDEFDPRVHEALMHALSPQATTTTCDKVVQAGYRIGDRVVRPALVTVVDPDPDAASAHEPAAGAAPAGTPEEGRADEGRADEGRAGEGRVDPWLDTEGRPHLTGGPGAGDAPGAGSH